MARIWRCVPSRTLCHGPLARDGPGRACRDRPWLFQTFPFREKEQEVSGVLCGTSGVGEVSNLPTEGLESIVTGGRVI